MKDRDFPGNWARSWSQQAWLGIAMVCAGCWGGDPEMVPIRGKVVFDSRELPQVCRLTFVPLADASGGKRPSGAVMEADGSYQPTKFRGVAGLYPGQYRIRVSYYDLKPGGNPDSDAGWKEQVYEPPEPLLVEPTRGSLEHDIHVP